SKRRLYYCRAAGEDNRMGSAGAAGTRTSVSMECGRIFSRQQCIQSDAPTGAVQDSVRRYPHATDGYEVEGSLGAADLRGSSVASGPLRRSTVSSASLFGSASGLGRRQKYARGCSTRTVKTAIDW